MADLIVSFGTNKGKPQPGDDGSGNIQIIDVRTLLSRNPFHDRTLRHLRGDSQAVQEDIRKTPFFVDSMVKLTKLVANSTAKVVYLGCTGGHHRSVYAAILIGQALGIPVKHRDINR